MKLMGIILLSGCTIQGPIASAPGNLTSNHAPRILALLTSYSRMTGEVTLTVYGQDFARGLTVLVGGVACANPIVTIPLQVECTIGIRTPSRSNIIVTNPDQQASHPFPSFVYPSVIPRVDRITPESGSHAGGSRVQVNGSLFMQGAIVRLGSTECRDVNVVSGDQITCTTARSTVGLADVTVMNPNNLSNYAGHRRVVFNFEVPYPYSPIPGGPATTGDRSLFGTYHASEAAAFYAALRARRIQYSYVESVQYGNETIATGTTVSPEAFAFVINHPGLAEQIGRALGLTLRPGDSFPASQRNRLQSIPTHYFEEGEDSGMTLEERFTEGTTSAMPSRVGSVPTYIVYESQLALQIAQHLGHRVTDEDRWSQRFTCSVRQDQLGQLGPFRTQFDAGRRQMMAVNSIYSSHMRVELEEIMEVVQTHDGVDPRFVDRPVTSAQATYLAQLRDLIQNRIIALNRTATGSSGNERDRWYINPQGGGNGVSIHSGYHQIVFDQVMDSIERSDEEAFYRAAVDFATIFGRNYSQHRQGFVDTFTYMFVTKRFPSIGTRQNYSHFLLRCGCLY